LADPDITRLWLDVLAEGHIRTLALQANHPSGAKKLVAACRKLVPNRGRPGFPVRVMIAGIPNVGKSTLFNLLVGKRKAIVRDQPAVTRREQRTEVPGGLELIDTPGVLWPKLDDQAGANRLAASGAIRETAYEPLLVARFLAEWLRERHPSTLRTRFKLPALPEDPDALLIAIANKRGCLTRGVGPDLGKVSDLLLAELRSGKLGRLSLEAPDDFPEGIDVEDTAAEDTAAEGIDDETFDDEADDDEFERY
jgi:ribosome biogenesis GTPase A